jgi:hypothetical protein
MFTPVGTISRTRCDQPDAPEVQPSHYPSTTNATPPLPFSTNTSPAISSTVNAVTLQGLPQGPLQNRPAAASTSQQREPSPSFSLELPRNADLGSVSPERAHSSHRHQRGRSSVSTRTNLTRGADGDLDFVLDSPSRPALRSTRLRRRRQRSEDDAQDTDVLEGTNAEEPRNREDSSHESHDDDRLAQRDRRNVERDDGATTAAKAKMAVSDLSVGLPSTTTYAYSRCRISYSCSLLKRSWNTKERYN